MVRDEPAFAAELGPQMTERVDKVARAMCDRAARDDDGSGCTCRSDGGTCCAFGLYGDLAHAALLAMGRPSGPALNEPTP